MIRNGMLGDSNETTGQRDDCEVPIPVNVNSPAAIRSVVPLPWAEPE